MDANLSHERLDVYRIYLEAASLCGDIVSSEAKAIAAYDHLDRAVESIGVNFMRANGLPFGSPQRVAILDIAIGSSHESAAALDVCLAARAVDEGLYGKALTRLWRVRGMLLGLKRVRRNEMWEESIPYGHPNFPFVELDLYRLALDGVRWSHDLLRDIALKTRLKRRLDTSTTGTVLNIAEGHGRGSTDDQNRFMKIAHEHACQTLLLLDLLVARKEITAPRAAEGKKIQARVLSMLHTWCASNEKRSSTGI